MHLWLIDVDVAETRHVVWQLSLPLKIIFLFFFLRSGRSSLSSWFGTKAHKVLNQNIPLLHSPGCCLVTFLQMVEKSWGGGVGEAAVAVA